MFKPVKSKPRKNNYWRNCLFCGNATTKFISKEWKECIEFRCTCLTRQGLFGIMWGYIDFVEKKRSQFELSRTEFLTQKYSIIVNHTDFIGHPGMFIRDLEKFTETYEYFNPSATAQHLPFVKDFSGMTREDVDKWISKILNLT